MGRSEVQPTSNGTGVPHVGRIKRASLHRAVHAGKLDTEDEEHEEHEGD